MSAWLSLVVACGNPAPVALDAPGEGTSSVVERSVAEPVRAGEPSARESDGGADRGGPTTACGDASCDAATEICVVDTPVGPSVFHACRPVPEGCEDTRTCACVGSTLCTGSHHVCSDSPEPNTVVCICPDCQ